jgi:hypothetical protein
VCGGDGVHVVELGEPPIEASGCPPEGLAVRANLGSQTTQRKQLLFMYPQWTWSSKNRIPAAAGVVDFQGDVRLRRVEQNVGAGTGRNKPCACGSGKKLKHCCANRKPANQSLVFKFEEPKTLTGCELGADGQVRPLEGKRYATPSSAWCTTTYARAKGEKVISRIPVPSDDTRFHADDTLQRYKNIFVIDTNTTVQHGVKVSIASLIVADLADDPGGLVWRFVPVGGYEFHNCADKQENLAWAILQSNIVSSPDYRLENRYAIVTDADLGHHEAYNERSAPIFGNTFLAPNIDLVYASADVTRGVLNDLIKRCDQEANKLRAALGSGRIVEGPPPVLNGPCSHFRWLRFRLRGLPPNWIRLGTALPFSMV